MTVQARETLVLDGQRVELRSLPLDAYLSANGIDLRAHPVSEYRSTGCYRGYMGVWDLHDRQLFLIGLLGAIGEPVDPALIFGARCQLPIAADWFSGRLEIHRGEQLGVHLIAGWGGFSSQCHRLYFKSGQLVAARCFDQARLLRKRFEREMARNADFRLAVALQGVTPGGPLDGLTRAGLRAIGLEGLLEAGVPEPWCSDLTEEENFEILERDLASCVRPAGAVPLRRPTTENGAPTLHAAV